VAGVILVSAFADIPARDATQSHQSAALDDLTRIVEPFGAGYSWAVLGAYGIVGLVFRWGEAFRDTELYSGGKVARYYVAEAPAGDVTLPVSPELGRPEHDEFRWVSFADANRLLVPRVQRIAEWAEGLLASIPR
jgi:hypothetical protein